MPWQAFNYYVRRRGGQMCSRYANEKLPLQFGERILQLITSGNDPFDQSYYTNKSAFFEYKLMHGQLDHSIDETIISI